MCGRKPFRGGTSRTVLHKNKFGMPEFKEDTWNVISREGIDLLKSMLSINPDDRPTAAEALKSNWFEKKFNYTEKKEDFNKKDRKLNCERGDLDRIILLTQSSLYLSFNSSDLNSIQEAIESKDKIEKGNSFGEKVQFSIDNLLMYPIRSRLYILI